MYSSYVGEGEARLRAAFARARSMAPATLFLDELDGFVGARPSRSCGFVTSHLGRACMLDGFVGARPSRSCGSATSDLGRACRLAVSPPPARCQCLTGILRRAGKRGQAGEQAGASQAAERMLSVLLTETDGLEAATGVSPSWPAVELQPASTHPWVRCAGVLLLAATNRPQEIDAALLRPGRFDVILYVPPPDCGGRLETLRVHTRGMPLAADVRLEVRGPLLL